MLHFEKIPSEIRHEAEDVMRTTAEACRRELALAKHDLPLRRLWRFDVKNSWSPHRTSCLGGDSGISMALHDHTPRGPWGFTWWPEYARFDADPCIGGLASPDWRHRIMAVTAHEVAHVAQGRIGRLPRTHRGRMAKVDLAKPHGLGWQRLYAILRAEIVNPQAKAAGGWVGALRDRSIQEAPWGLPSLDAIEQRSGVALRLVDQMITAGRSSWSTLHLAFGELRSSIRVGGLRRRSWTRLCDGAIDFRLADLDPPTDQSVSRLVTCPDCLLAVHEAQQQ